ncbi:MAG: hypothetical protein QXG00_07025 [Candidatus Woesearchaeota archaeon]
MLYLDDKDINNYDEDNIENSDDFEEFYGINDNEEELDFDKDIETK